MTSQKTPSKDTPLDLEIDCVDCGKPFTWTGGDQLYFRDRELANPKRCMKCRKVKRDTIEKRKAASQAFPGY